MTEPKAITSTETRSDLTEAPIRVLNVDDDLNFLNITKQILEMFGTFQVDTASSVDDAMKKLKEKTYDAVVSDYYMPEKDGLAFLKELRESGNTIPFIMFTGKGREEVVVEALNLGADQYFNKIGEPEAVYRELTHGIHQAVERRRAVEEVWKGGERLRAILASSPDIITVSDLQGNIVDCNEAAWKLSGFSSKEELLGKSSFEFIAEKDRKRALENLKKTFEEGTTRNIEYTLIRKDGEEYAGELSASILKDPSGYPIGFVGVARDITERRKLEMEMEHFNRVLRAVRSVNQLITREKNRGILLKGACDVLIETKGYFNVWVALLDDTRRAVFTVESGLGKDFSVMKDRLERGELTLCAQKALTQSDVVVTENPVVDCANCPLATKYGGRAAMTVRLKHGEKVYGILTASIPKEFLNEEEIDLFKEVAGDIANALHNIEREEAKRESEERLSSFMDSSPDGFYILDSELNYVDINDAGLTLFPAGTEKEDIIGKNIVEIAPDIKETGRYHKYLEVLKTGNPFFVDNLVPHPKFEDVNLALRAFKVGNNLGIITTDITERKKAEREISIKDSAIASSINAVALADPKGNLTYVNQAFLIMWGYDDEKEVLGNPGPRITQLEKAIEVKQALAKKGSWQGEQTAKRKDGSTFSVYLSASMVKDEVGKPICGMAMFTDITERKKIEKALQESEKRFRTISTSAKDGIILMDDEGNISYWNPEAENMFGYTKEEAIGKELHRLLGPKRFYKDYERGFAKFKETGLGAAVGKTLELAAIRRDGTEFPIELSLSALNLEGKWHATGIIRDITERKRMEEELHKSQEMLRKIIESSEDMVSVKDLEGRFIYWYSALQYGFKTEEVIGKTYYDFEDPATASRKIEENRQVASTGKNLMVENQVNLNGQNYWFSTLKYPIRNASGEIVAIGTIERNITKLKQMEKKLRVVGGLTRHDVRNKLTAIRANTYLAKQRLPGDHNVLDYLSEIDSVVGQANRIFDFAKAYELLGVEELAYMDVEKAIDEAVSLFSDMHGVEMVNDCGGLRVLADSLLRHLFYNLFDNSLKHGENVTKIRVYYEAGKDELNLVYEDDGVGIPKAEKEKVFEQGYGKGTGYGLFLIKKMCEVYGWTVIETGKLGEGVRFIISIPKMNIDKGRASSQSLK